jgi:uncharacterized protein YkwD
MIRTITRALALLIFVSPLFLLPAQTRAQDVDLSISAQVKGLSLEFPLINITGNFTSDNQFLATIKFGGNAPLLVSEKKGLSSNTDADPIVSSSAVTPSPYISPFEPFVTSVPSSVIIQEPVTKLIFDSLPTPSPTETPLATRTPTRIPTPTAAADTQTQPVSGSTQLSNGGLNADKLFAMANAHRQSIGLAPFQKDDRACQLAVSRAPEINGEIAAGVMHSGLRARSLPYWNTENIISMGSEEGAFNWWIHDQIHKEAIEGNYAYSCVACSGNACAQEFTNFQSK